MYLSDPSLGVGDTYVPGLTPEYVAATFGVPVGDVAKLGSAENPFGPSPKALAAVKEAAKVSNYPDWTSRALREKIAAKYGFSPGACHLRRGRNRNHVLDHSRVRGAGRQGAYVHPGLSDLSHGRGERGPEAGIRLDGRGS